MGCEEYLSAMLDLLEYELFEKEPLPRSVEDVKERWRAITGELRENIVKRLRGRLLL